LVLNTPSANTITTAEHTIGLLMALARNIPQAYLSMTEGKWDRKIYGGMELAEKTLGLIGLGRIGLHVAKVANALGMRVIAYDPYISTAGAETANVELLSFDKVLNQADFLSLHSVLNNETRGMINAAAIAKMKDGARIVNTARGARINDEALIAALESGKIAGAALDTFAVEPLAVDSPYRHLPQVIATPHLAASTTEAQLRAGSLAVERMLAFVRGEDYGQALNNPA
jgi:D-3-phosphoglycerate dehydrogenase